MKKIITTAGLAALGVASLNAANGSMLSQIEASKVWTASISMRGFYDDNPTTAPNNVRNGSFGFEVRPSLALNFPMDQTYIGLSYTYDMRYYFDRADSDYDQSHDVLLKLNHDFNERFSVKSSHEFEIFQEPSITDGTTPQRANGDNMHYRGDIDFMGQFTERLGVNVGYANNFWDYQQSGTASYSALLDRDEHLAHIDLRWTLEPALVGLVGYQFGYFDYAGNGDMWFGGPDSTDKSYYSHYLYVGADYKQTAKLTLSPRIGAQYNDYLNVNGQNDWTPYVDTSATYTYAPGSYAQFGIRHTLIASSTANNESSALDSDFTLNEEATTLYANVNHKLTAKVTGTLLFAYQYATYNGGTADGETAQTYMLGANLDYKIDEHLAAEAGYNYDTLLTDVDNQGYHRNRFYIGLRATY